MRIKEFFNKKINVAWVTAVLILIAILTICVATSHSKYVLEKELTFSLGIIESDEWNKRTLILGEQLGIKIKATNATQVVFGYEDDFSTEIEGTEGIAVGLANEAKSFAEDDIKLYTVTEENITTAYILSEYQIKANADSSKMFYFDNNEALTNIFFLNFETSIVINMESMFEGCKNLTELDLSKFETAKVTNISRMFYNCNSLETIYASELWDISGIEPVQDDVFYNCVNLKVENSTAYDEENPIITSDYARIDTPADGETAAIPGYFTYKSVEEEQVTFNLVRPNVTENTTTYNKNETTTPSDSSNETNINKDNQEDETGTGTGTETETEKELESNTETDTNTDTNTDNNNTDSKGDTSLDDDTTSNDSTNTKGDAEETKENTELEQDGEKVEDEKVEETTEENIEENGAENTATE